MQLQISLPGFPEPQAANDPAPLTAPPLVVEAMHEMIIGLIPKPVHPTWHEKLREGRFDNGPLMQAIIAGWLLGTGALR